MYTRTWCADTHQWISVCSIKLLLLLRPFIVPGNLRKMLPRSRRSTKKLMILPKFFKFGCAGIHQCVPAHTMCGHTLQLSTYYNELQWNLYNPEFLDPTKSLYTNECFTMHLTLLIRQFGKPTHFSCPKECRIRHVPLYYRV